MSSTLPPTIVDPTEWKNRTASTLVPRDGDLRRVDQAYERWYADRFGHAAQLDLLAALDTFLLSHGRYWDKVTRNRDSNGLMAYIHGLLKEAATRPDPLQALDIPMARYGVLYLLGNTRISMDDWKLGLEGLQQVANVGLAGASNALGAVTLGNSSLTARTVANTATPVALKSAIGIVAAPVTQKRPLGRENPNAHEADPKAQGLTYALQSVKATVLNTLEGRVVFFQRLMLADGLTRWRVSGALVRKAIAAAAEYIVGHAVPFLRTGIDLAHGIAKTIEHVYTNGVVAYLRCQSFQIQAGHPLQIANAIQRSLLADVGSSLASVAVGAGKMFLEGITGGAAVLVNAIVDALEWLTRLLLKWHEKTQIEAFLVDAAVALLSEREKRVHDPQTGQLKPNIGVGRGGLINDPQAFSAFFDRGCKASVCIPMLVLNSGICGHAMTYTRMFRSDATNADVIPQNHFDNSVAFFSRLKAIGARYVRNRGFRFSSARRDVDGYLMHAVRDHQLPEGKMEKLLAFV